MKEEKVKKIVRKRYAKVAKSNGFCCASKVNCCSAPTDEQISKIIGYNQEELNAVPEGANLGLGCGNPTALASLKEGEKSLRFGVRRWIRLFFSIKKGRQEWQSNRCRYDS